MCNTTPRLPNQVVSAPFRRLNSNNYLKEAPQQPIKSEPSCESVPSTPAPSASTLSNGDVPKKPMRPLTAYHIYFQIEREFIIQTLSGEDADKSIHEGKKCLDDVPERYINTKLSPDWYFGPGKRAKRKHRKQHGKIGFLELSRVISTRWAKLEETNPDIKQFVSKLAKQELEVYQREVEEYKELTKDMIPSAAPAKTTAKKSKKRKQSEQSQQQEVAPAASMMMMPQHQMMQQHQMMASQPTPEMIASCQRTFYGAASQPIEDKSFMNNSVQLRQEINQLKNEIEYVNSCITKHSHHFEGQPTPTFTQTTDSAPPKKQFYRRQSSNISISIFDNVMDESGKVEPKTKKAKKSFYRRQSSDMSLSFLDSIMEEAGKNKSSSKKTKKSFYRRQSSNMSLSFLESVMDDMRKNESSKKAKSSSAPKKNFYRRQSSTLSLSFLDPIVDKITKDEASIPIDATSAVKTEISDKSSPTNVADINDDDIMSLWVAQNSL